MKPTLLHSARAHLFWLAVYATLDMGWIWHDLFAYNFSHFEYQPVLLGLGCRPEQYRIAAPFAARALQHWLHLHSLTAGCIAIDLVSAVLLSLALYSLVQLELVNAPTAVRVGAKALVGLWMPFYLHWGYASSRVETVPSALYLVLSLLLIHRLQTPLGRRQAFATGAALVLLALVQGWVRADIAIVLGFSLTVAAVSSYVFGQRSQGLRLMAVGIAATAVSTASLLYIAGVLYPNRHYCGSVVELTSNLHYSYNYIPFLTFCAPLAGTLTYLARHVRTESTAHRTLLIAVPCYVVLWSFLGNWGEARVAVPYGLCILPLTAALMARWASTAETGV